MLVAYKFENNPFDPIEWCAVLIVIGNYLLIGIKSKLIPGSHVLGIFLKSIGLYSYPVAHIPVQSSPFYK